MNKSKFLKKSLAMILAVMLVVAMIPLGASANSVETTNDNTVVRLTATQGTLTGSGLSFTDKLPYYADEENDGMETLTVMLHANTGYTTVKYVITNANGEDEDEVDAEGTTISVPVDSKKVTFVASDGEDKNSDKYTVTFEKPGKSTSTAIASATITDAEFGKVTGAVSGKNVSFVMPWGWEESDGSMDAALVLEYPVKNQASIPVTVDFDAPVTETVYSQAGNGSVVTVTAKEMDCLNTLTVGGVAAVLNDDGEYDVVLPEGTDLEDEEGLAVTYKVYSNAGVTVAGASWNGSPAEGDGKYTNGKKVAVEEGPNTLALTSNKGTTKTYKVNVSVKQSEDASIKSFTATAEVAIKTGGTLDFTADGVVSGKKLTVELPANADLTAVTVAITPADGATVTVVETGDDLDDGVNGVYTATVDLSNGAERLVTVVAEDDVKTAYYELSATKAANEQSSPAITGAVLKIGDDEYKGSISGKTITFQVPYSTVDENVVGATIAWTKTYSTAFVVAEGNHVAWDEENVVSGTNEVAIISDAGDVVTYTVKITKMAAKTGKTLDSLKFSSAATEDAVAADNTYTATVSSSKVTVNNLPYSFKNENNEDKYDTALVPIFTIPEGAALYIYVEGEMTPAITSGYEPAEGDGNLYVSIPSYSVLAATDEDGKFTTKIVVADEAAKVELAKLEEGDPFDLGAAPYKGHVTIYDVEPKFDAPQTGHNLTAISADNGLVSGKVSGLNIELTVPHSYVDDPEKAFFADYTVSKLATVSTEQWPAYGIKLPETAGDDGDAGQLKVVTGDDGYELQVCDGADVWTTVDTLYVTDEAETEDTIYTVTVKKADAETGADITSLKVDGTAGVINTNSKTVTVTLRYGYDLTAVTLDWEVSKLASSALVDFAPAGQNEEGKDVYDVSEPFQISVTAEDGKTVNVYTVTVVARTQFTDVPVGKYYYDYVMEAAAAGIVSGRPDGTFAPTETISRQDFASMVTRMLGVDTSSYTTTAFADNSDISSYAVGAVAYLAESGIVSGGSNNKFNPKNNITRQEAASIVARALGLPRTATSTSFSDDAKIASWAKGAVAACAAAKIISGRPNGTFAPTENITRADAAIILVLSLNK